MARRRRRADVEDPAPDQRPHGHGAPDRRARDDALRDRPHSRRAHSAEDAPAKFEAETGTRLTYLPFILKTVVDGLKSHPVLNATVSGSNVIYRKQYNLGIAVALDWGLIVPVIKHAEDLSLTGLTRAVNDLADRARTKRLKPEEVQGATFSITNPGVFGSLMGTPIIPLGTSGILGLGAIEKRPKVDHRSRW